MEVEVKLFAGLREAWGSGEARVDVPEGTTVGALPDLLFPNQRRERPGWPGTLLYAVDRRYVPANTVLTPGVEVALVPPLGGG